VLQVINELNSRDVNGNNGSSEPLPVNTIASSDLGTTFVATADSLAVGSVNATRNRLLASTQTYASGSPANLGTANREAGNTDAADPDVTTGTTGSFDSVLKGGLELQSRTMNRTEEAVGSLASNLRPSQLDESDSSEEAFDSALADLFSEVSQPD